MINSLLHAQQSAFSDDSMAGICSTDSHSDEYMAQSAMTHNGDYHDGDSVKDVFWGTLYEYS